MYYMALGARDAHGKGLVLLYRSEDLKDWKYHGRITTREAFGYMWECPDLFELDGQLCLICCPQGVNPAAWITGMCISARLWGWIRFGRRMYASRIALMDGSPMVDRGFDFYAPQTF